MAVATGTAALIAAGIGAAQQTGGAIIGSRANSRALEAQERAAREAISYQREQDWRARMAQRSQYDNYMRSVYGDRYQPNPVVSPAVVPAAAPAVAAPVVAPVAPVAAPVAPVVAPLPGGDGTATPPLVTPTTEPVRSLADIGPGWSASNYSRYLGGRR